ncbi:PREDICTED: uncharacterized protein LOC104611088 [Nelumbo nucifera]|uniref:Uncharacterized protein LOC104611088 n=1 Tax=Nelumbo nucifera TaxID=4432 RepID=A0A1U8B5X7_NELNU|nr:PREDICTED: uncharacterized protein LOC104611088 [Nelumbo nucifera]
MVVTGDIPAPPTTTTIEFVALVAVKVELEIYGQFLNQRDTISSNSVVEENKDIKSQITKLTNALVIQERGKIPSQPQTNPKGSHMVQESTSDSKNIMGVHAITTRSGKVLDGPLPSPSRTNVTTSRRTEDAPSKQLEKEATIQVLAYAKVINDLCTMKMRHHVKKIAFLTEQVSAVIEQRTLPKYKDPGCPTIDCHIGTQEFSQALLDLGASVNLMPYLVYLQLGLGEIKSMSVVLQLANRYIRKSREIVEDVLLQIDKFYYPVDFLVLDTQSVIDSESKILLILRRPFLATANALINCRNGLMDLSFGNMTLEVNIFHVGITKTRTSAIIPT